MRVDTSRQTEGAPYPPMSGPHKDWSETYHRAARLLAPTVRQGDSARSHAPARGRIARRRGHPRLLRGAISYLGRSRDEPHAAGSRIDTSRSWPRPWGLLCSWLLAQQNLAAPAKGAAAPRKPPTVPVPVSTLCDPYLRNVRSPE